MSECKACALRSRIQSLRIKVGLHNAKDQGRLLGRPPKSFSVEDIKRMFDLRIGNYSYREISTTLGIPKNTVYRTLQKHIQKHIQKEIEKKEGLYVELSTLTQQLNELLQGD